MLYRPTTTNAWVSDIKVAMNVHKGDVLFFC